MSILTNSPVYQERKVVHGPGTEDPVLSYGWRTVTHRKTEKKIRYDYS